MELLRLLLKKKNFYFRGEKLSQMTLNKKIIFLNVLKFITLLQKNKKKLLKWEKDIDM